MPSKHNHLLSAAWLADLTPQASMPRNSQCWCGSGKKFKKCHKDRESAPPINPFAADKEFRSICEKGTCSCPPELRIDCDGGTSIDAHTIQKRGGLNAIAEAGHVLCVLPNMTDLIKHDGFPPLRRIGVGNASVFPGFCNKHDTEFFRSIEGKAPPNLDADSALRFSYRAVAFERFRKLAVLNYMNNMKMMDSGKPFPIQAAIQQGLHYLEAGLKLGLRDIETWKQKYDNILMQGSDESVGFFFVQFDRVLPFVGCCAFLPEFDFQGGALQTLGQPHKVLEHVALNVTSYENRTVACLGWLGPKTGPAARFVDSLSCVLQSRIAAAFLRLAFEHSENIYLKQSWWEGLVPTMQNDLSARIRSGGSDIIRTADCLADKGSEQIDANVEAVSRS
jgi:SEC-C motif